MAAAISGGVSAKPRSPPDGRARFARAILGKTRDLLMTPTGIAFGLFSLAVVLESAVWATCLYRLKSRHPHQWQHAEQPLLWQGRTLLSARRTMVYFQDQTYLSSLDEGGMRFCNRNRTMMLGAYWLTVMAGAALVVTLAVSGWG